MTGESNTLVENENLTYKQLIKAMMTILYNIEKQIKFSKFEVYRI